MQLVGNMDQTDQLRSLSILLNSGLTGFFSQAAADLLRPEGLMQLSRPSILF